MELLGPSGNYESAVAAINAGCDAIYIGGKKYSARMNADNFSDDEIVNIIDYAHIFNVKVYVTINTLLYQDEFFDVVNYAKFLYEVGVDAIIVQDLGLASYLHKTLPDLVLHASTQLNCHNLNQAIALKEIGFQRVVLAREAPLSLCQEVKKIGLEVEVFVHGALCVSYSGNCLMSSFIGSRSGNRGRCAQPCRLNYSLLKDGETVVDNKYLLSTKDLNDLEYLSKFRNYDVDSLKIEGRLKSIDYIYLVCKAYADTLKAIKENKNEVINNYQKKLQQIFSRSFTKGFMLGADKFNVLNVKSSSHQGERIGTVINYKKGRVSIRLEKDVHRLDGIRFNDGKQYGRTIQKMFVNSNEREVAKKGEIIEINRLDVEIKNGCEVIRTSSYFLQQELQSIMSETRKVPFNITIFCYKNKPLRLEIKDNKKVYYAVGELVQEALNTPTTYERIKSQINKTGNYPFVFKDINIYGDEDIFIPIAKLNALRNEILDKIIESKKIRRSYELLEYKSSYDITKINNQNVIIDEHKRNVDIRINNKKINYLSRINSALEIPDNSYVSGLYLGKDLIASPYSNITNSYALDAYFENGYSLCSLSLELDSQSIKSIVEDYYNRHGVNPNIMIYVYGKFDAMIMKSCPIGCIYHNDKTQCGKCLLNNYSLKDRMGVIYPLMSDENCNIRVINDRPISLINKLNVLLNLDITNYLIHFTNETENERLIIKDAILNKKEAYLNKMTLGHFEKRAM